MQTIINYFRQCFCKHKLKLVGEVSYFESDFSKRPYGHTNVYFCQKCGYTKKIKY